MSIYELGGFAEYPEDIDGDFASFNFCLAEDYYIAMKKEDFASLGYIDGSNLSKINYWLKTVEQTKEELDEIKKIPTGLIKTKYNRTFADSVIANCKGDLASQLIYKGNYDIRLFATAIAYNEDDIIDVFCYFPETIKTKQEYLEFIQNVFSKLDEIFLICNDYKQELKILKNIKLLLNKFIYNVDKFGKIEANEIKFNQNYHWLQAIKDKNKVKQLELIPDKKGNLTIS